MKENVKIIIACVITSVITLTGSVVANTILQANSISYKTSNGDTTDVNSALDRLFDVANINERLGSNDISSIGDGTVTGAISNLSNNFVELATSTSTSTSNVVNVPNLKNYNALLVILTNTDETGINGSIIAPLSLFKSGTITAVAYNAASSSVSARIKYINDTSIYAYVTQANWKCTVYGIR